MNATIHFLGMNYAAFETIPLSGNVTCGENVVIYEPANLYDCIGRQRFCRTICLKSGQHADWRRQQKFSRTPSSANMSPIGSRCFIGHGVMFANDMFRDSKTQRRPATVGKNYDWQRCLIGSGATILAVTVCVMARSSAQEA